MTILDSLFATKINYGLILESGLYLLAGIILGSFINFIVNQIGNHIIYPWIRKHSIENYKSTVSSVKGIGRILKWIIIVLFILFSFSVFDIYLLQEILKVLISFVPKLGAAALVFFLGLLVTGIISKRINNMQFKSHELASKIVQNILLFAVILSALELINIKLTPFFYLFLIIVSSLGLALAIALGISFGFALKPKISSILSKI